MTIASECARSVGMRTAVHETLISWPKILTISHATFISSFVYPFAWNLSMCGITLNNNWCAKTSGLGTLPSFAQLLVEDSSSAIPGAPAPLDAWYVDIRTFLIPNFWCSGQRAMTPIAVVQLGLEM